MARKSKWSAEDRKKMLKMVNDGITEQEIRRKMSTPGRAMTSPAFSQQLKMAMVEAGQIKQTPRSSGGQDGKEYLVTAKGRLTVSDFSELTGYKEGAKFVLEKPRGRSKAWRLVPIS